MTKTLCFTGHRPNKLHGYDVNSTGNQEMLEMLSYLIETSIQNGFTNFITGMALGIDQWAARLVIECKKQYPDIKLIAAVPCKGHSSRWIDESKREYSEILSLCDEIVMVSNEEYTSWCMQKRNEWMVDNSDSVFAVWDGSSGGTDNCVKYAQKKEKNIVRLHPFELTVGKL